MRIREGIIQSVNYKNGTVSATFEGADDCSLDNLQVQQLNNKSYNMPSEKDVGYFIFDEDDRGVFIGTIYSLLSEMPTSKNDLIINVEGLILKIDREAKTIDIETPYEIIAKCKSFLAEATEDITIKAKKIIFDGEVEATKNIKALLDVKAGAVSLTTHVHTSSSPGTPTTPPAPGGA